MIFGNSRHRMAGATILVALILSGCGNSFSSRQQPLDSFSAEDIYKRAEFELEAKKPDEAARYFGEVERLYPYSEWAKRALIMQAFAYHRDEDYEAARSSAQRFLDFYPADEDAAYAQYLMALSYYDQIDDVGRDQGLTFQALQAMREVIEKYPDSEYARSSILKFDLAFDHLAAKEMEIGRYYLKRKHYPASINRFRVVVEEFQTTTHTPEALFRLIEAYLSLGLNAEAQTAGAILGHNFRSSEWYQDGFTLLTGRGLALEPSGKSWLSDVYRQVLKGEWL
ncbi:outer membrane protein assembly factor BamD [Oceaniovalibus sp. ACAM 378]|uniref:outer membrane protein assembly factor BamD n=1 Tax=Oceaniovalibus sp. ACAM 378 TaxID=2599923 RepID=UPI0011DBC94E|nr:outer membrane protein assembly factor BamD [Oceaniovalibus sp. ACAM 378]TYB87998.1 outer membrane protein assembly factor BamD [Oceaniovalibus sp. ACAM 378]